MNRSKSFIKFLGTAGARFVMIEQLRSSGGIWLQHKQTKCLIDPGPGSLLRCLMSRPRFDPRTLDAVILTHKHLDHCGDVNVIIEAMSDGLRGTARIFAPSDCFGENGVVYTYLYPHLERHDLRVGASYTIKDIRFEAVTLNRHAQATFGLKVHIAGTVISLTADTAYYKELEQIFDKSDILICNTVFYEPQAQYDHLSFFEAVDMVKRMNVKRAIFTHFGRVMLKHSKDALRYLKQEKLMDKITLADDGMVIKV